MIIELNEREIAQTLVDLLGNKGLIGTDGHTPYTVNFEQREDGRFYAKIFPAPAPIENQPRVIEDQPAEETQEGGA
jgi:hypothetical protein